MQRVRRFVTLWLVPFLAVVASFGLLVYFWGRYPDPLAVHWGLDGAPNGTLPLSLYAVGMIGGMLLAWYGLVTNSKAGLDSPLTAVVYFIIGLLGVVNAQVLHFNLDADTWEDVRNLDALTFGGVLLGGLLIAGLGWLLAGGRGGVREDVVLEPVETVASAWTGTASNLWIALIAAIAIGLTFIASPIVLAILVVVAALMIIFAFVRVDADADRVRIALGPLGWPRKTIPMTEITSAGAIDVQPIAYGGWGWRIRPGRRAYVIRGGPAIRLERPTGTATVVTVDGAAEGAAVIDSLARTGRYG
jgi:hypothetical protein